MGPRLSAQTSIFGIVFFVSKSLLGIERQKKLEKFAILTRKPRSHVRILIYRTWPIRLFQNGCSQSSRFPTAGQGERGLRERDWCAVSPSGKVTRSNSSPGIQNTNQTWACSQAQNELSTASQSLSNEIHYSLNVKFSLLQRNEECKRCPSWGVFL